jgi:hypothetical protein
MTDPTCGVAHGGTAEQPTDRVLVAVFASPVAAYLVRYGADLGFRTVLVEPDAARRAEAAADVVVAGLDEWDDGIDGAAPPPARPRTSSSPTTTATSSASCCATRSPGRSAGSA